jgi:CheY-like chemotaxis protein
MQKTILLVDDDTAIRNLYQELLTGAGYAVDVAVDGKEGLEKIKASTYDLILLDIMMPQIDGIGVLDEIKSKNLKHAPILFMTNLLNDPATKEAVQKGAIGVVTKVNLAPDQFLATINQTLGQQ